ncbi:MAG: M48 family metallopeptidase [Planctomycetota bacterium]
MRYPLIATLAATLLAACSSTPISGRSNTLVFLSDSQQVQLGEEAYAEYLGGAQIITSGSQAAMVERVMNNLVAALGAEDPGFPWEVKLVRDDATVNAWCLPGGKMAVYTGILPVTQDETGLAVVMGHEIAHAVAEHGARRMQYQLGKETVFEMVQSLYPDSEPFMGLADSVVEYGAILPFGREDELESDHIGLILMARAGYDPREAVGFWSRMAALGSSGTPAWMSTHPSNEQRIQQLEDEMPNAIAIYQQATGKP